MDPHTGALFRSHRYRSSGKSRYQVTTVWYRSLSLLAGGPVLLTCTQDGSFSFFSVALEIKGYLTLSGSLKLAPRVHSIRASFCPLLSLEKGEYIVAGSEDSNVYFYDLTRPKHTCVNKLQGHRFPVGDVAWNHGENLLATSDIYGIVILWKREKTRQLTICMYTALKKTTRNSWLVLNSIAYYFPVGKMMKQAEAFRSY
uniref:Uncharacterized protein n=1 Tax=Populus trichocarpa TaxID=3694 RepID=A0A3N7FJA0_POPTR